MATAATVLGIAIVALAIAIWFSGRLIGRAIADAAAEVAAAIREVPSGSLGETRIVVVDPSRGDHTVPPTFDIPSFDGDSSDEILRLHQMRYESSGDWRVEASTDDSIDLQDDAAAMTRALRQVGLKNNRRDHEHPS